VNKAEDVGYYLHPPLTAEFNMRRRQSLGRRGEDIAAHFLQKEGYEIVTRNWHCREGEIDIVAQRESEFVFVEVRTRRSDRFGTPEESITTAKQTRFVSACHAYLMATEQEDIPWHIDVIAIVMGKDGQVTRLNHIDHAF
jgi:putative endonuclease